MLHFQETSHQVDILGRVADFCPICREIRSFTLRSQVTVRQSGFILVAIPIIEESESEETGSDRVCDICNIDLPAVAPQYSAVLNRPELGLEDLIRETNPGLRKRVEARLALENQIRAGGLEPERRRQLLLEPFLLLEHRIRGVIGEAPGLFERSIVPFAAVVAIAGLFLGDLFPKSVRGIVRPGFVLALVLALVLMIRRGMLFLGRKTKLGLLVRLEIHPLLGRALKPLNPSPAELAGALRELRMQRKISGRLLCRDAILAEMHCVK